ncbi:hypothetical protein ElyMa_003181700 [Elysia marginata]|uniref:Reverse transcriptase zinc-binding domain-containing protein n=1 Tax=Elysia marginata TaxID=1093978 RepID=A0AAV4IXH2_9GAST|nr:hypothetical protein ElyMa_003181700 [Elysia marginata]
MRTIGICLKSTPTQWLPTISSIASVHIRRKNATQKIIKRIEDMADNIPLKQIYKEASTARRLRSRNPFNYAKIKNSNATEEWRKDWENNIPLGGSIITNPTQPLPGFTILKRKHWVITKRLRTRHAETAYMMHKWKLKGSPMCQRCSKAPETTDHIVLNCPGTK